MFKLNPSLIKMRWAKVASPVDELPGAYNVRVTRRYNAIGTEAVSEIPKAVFEDIDDWCADVGLARPSQSLVTKFPPINLVSGDSIDFALDIKFTCGKMAMMFKLAWGGIGHTGIKVESIV
jgi:hypothetical protein